MGEAAASAGQELVGFAWTRYGGLWFGREQDIFRHDVCVCSEQTGAHPFTQSVLTSEGPQLELK